MKKSRLRTLVTALMAVIALVLTACGTSPGDPRGSAGSGGKEVLKISAIPDQDPQELQRTYGALSKYLSKRLDVEVSYASVSDYTASVTTFARGDLHLVFFGGLTGVQARTKVPGAIPLAQRDIDEEFRSVFIANRATGLEPVKDVAGLKSLAGHSFTFGSDVSTSGRVMPQHFLTEAGVSTKQFKGEPGYSDSHDATAALVQAGTYQVGALSSAVWDERMKAGKIDKKKVREIFRTPPYHDYHWLARPDLDKEFGDGFTEKLKGALLDLDGSDGEERKILELFTAGSFVETEPGNYREIETVARSLGLLN